MLYRRKIMCNKTSQWCLNRCIEVSNVPMEATHYNKVFGDYFKFCVETDMVWCYCSGDWVIVPLSVVQFKSNEYMVEV